MLSSNYSKNFNDSLTRRIFLVETYTIPVSATGTTLSMFTIPVGFWFYPNQNFYFYALSQTGGFSGGFGNNYEFAGSSGTAIFSSGAAAGTLTTLAYSVTLSNTRLGISGGNNFLLKFGNTVRQFTVRITISGILSAV